ncbi:MAG: AAA family ATPase [Ignavibacteria bacterium]|nr:AAA family ATPase [Ignavibacteria bacterium]
MSTIDYRKTLSEALQSLKNNDFITSDKLFEKLNYNFPENEEVLIYYAFAILGKGDPVKAFELANAAVELRPDLIYLRKLRGQIFAKLGFNEAAKNDLELYRGNIISEYKICSINLIRALADSGNFEKAKEECNTLLSSHNWDELKRINDYLSIASNIEKFNNIKDIIEKAETSFNNGELWFAKFISNFYLRNKDIDDDIRIRMIKLHLLTLLNQYQYKPAKKIVDDFSHLIKKSPEILNITNQIRNYSIKISDSDKNLITYKKDNIIPVVSGGNIFFSNKTLQVISAKFFNVIDDSKQNQRVYYKQFSAADIKFIGVELIFKNHFFNKKKMYYKGFAIWYLNDFEIGRSYFKMNINENWDSVIYVQTWGSDEHFYWEKGSGKVEIYIDDFKVSESLFKIGEQKEYLLPSKEKIPQKSFQENSVSEITVVESEKENLQKLLAELNNFVGLKNIKNSIKEFIDYLEFLKERKKLGLKVQDGISLNSIFLGNPGTGKTTVARLMAKIFYSMGLLKENKLIEVDRAALVGQYIGETAQKTEKIISEAVGGVLFIDEAYSLINKNNSQDFGREAIDILLKRMEDRKGEFAVIVAGYPEEMQNFLESNPGLKSRFSHTFEFEDYSPLEMINIIQILAEYEDYFVTDGAKILLEKELTALYRNRDKTFGNARLARKIFDELKLNVSKRFLNSSENKKDKYLLSHILAEDVSDILKLNERKIVNISINEEELQNVLTEMNKLTGLEKVKKEISDIVKLAKFYQERGENVKEKFSSHILFLGNPGTGKTTVARLLSRLYSALGILEKGHLVETDREGLVAGFVGQTAIKTKNVINKALGGTLFIDEAYSLTSGKNEFGAESVDVLLKKMEDDRGKFLTIAAGYTNEMKHFINSNPGLQSRFNKIFYFDDYTPQELLKIAKDIFSSFKMNLENEACDVLMKYFDFLYDKRDKNFGNARIVRNICEEIKRNTLLREAESKNRELKKGLTIRKEDITLLYSGEVSVASVSSNKEDIEKIIKEISELPGLNNVKRSIDKLISGLQISEMRKQKGLPVLNRSYNCFFAGNRGTGKYTIAGYIAKIYKLFKIITYDEIIKIEKSDIFNENNILTTEKLESILNISADKILYFPQISNFLTLSDILLKELFRKIFSFIELNNSRTIIIISDKQNYITELNKRLADFTHYFPNYFSFQDYSPRELLEITAHIALESGYTFDEGSLQQMFENFTLLYNHRDDNFTNAYLVQNMLSKAIANQEDRIAVNLNDKDHELNLIMIEDVPKIT